MDPFRDDVEVDPYQFSERDEFPPGLRLRGFFGF